MVKEQHVICSKERELGIMATQIENIKETTDKIDKKIDKLLDEIPRTYATKRELKEMGENLMEYNKRQDRDREGLIGFFRTNWDKLLLGGSAIVYLILKLNGLL